MPEAKSVLVVHHTVSLSTETIHQTVLEALAIDELAGVSVRSMPALSAGAHDTLRADGVVLLTPVNIGYLSGAMKHYFDQIYYPCLEATRSLPFAAVLHSASDASGALRALHAITTGMQWHGVGDPLVVSGEPDAAMCTQIGELAATLGAHAADLL